ncbi:hypothetical protein ACEN8K_41785, partial [Variovorax sp. CT11-76]
RGGLVDIAGGKIAIVGAGLDAAGLQADGYLVIDSASLSNFGAGSLLVGGKRQGNALGLEIDVTATDIVVRNGEGSELSGPEIILAASEQVAIEGGSRVRAKGAGGRGSGNLVMKPKAPAVYTDPDGNLDDNGDGVIDARDAADDVLTSPTKDWGALVRLATGDAVQVLRQNVDTTRGGLVTIGAGELVDGGAALLMRLRPAYAVVDNSVAGSTATLRATAFPRVRLTTRFVVLQRGINDAMRGWQIEYPLRTMVGLAQAEGRGVVLTGLTRQAPGHPIALRDAHDAT